MRLRDRTHFSKGHAFDEANTYRYVHWRGSVLRGCRTCRSQRSRAYEQKGAQCPTCGSRMDHRSKRCILCCLAERGWQPELSD